MARIERTWVRQAFMKCSFMRRRTTAIYDCWPDPPAGACSVFWEDFRREGFRLDKPAYQRLVSNACRVPYNCAHFSNTVKRT